MSSISDGTGKQRRVESERSVNASSQRKLDGIRISVDFAFEIKGLKRKVWV